MSACREQPWALANIGDRRAVEPLNAVLTDTERAVRDPAAVTALLVEERDRLKEAVDIFSQEKK